MKVSDRMLLATLTAIAVAIMVVALWGCGTAPPAGPPDPAIRAKIVSVCLYSGVFEAANTEAGQLAGLVPLPGAGTIGTILTSLGNAAVTDICTNPDKYVADVAIVESLIARFKTLGKM
jgi:hypothetical protein